MKAKEQRDFAIKFSDKRDLGEFCVLLQAAKIPFRLGGFETVVLAMEPELMYKSLPEPCRRFLDSHHPRVMDASRDEKRRGLLDEKQTEEVLRELSKPR